MRKRLVSTCILVLMVLTLPALVGLHISQPEFVKVDSQLMGKEADDYIAQKAAREPAFARFLKESEAELSAKGWKRPPSASLVLYRRVQASEPGVVAKLMSRVVGMRVQAQTLYSSTGSGEIIFYSWDDGNWNNWEGGIWVQDWGIGDTFWFDVQFDYSGSMGGAPFVTTWMGYVAWHDREGRDRGHGREASRGGASKGFFATLADKICPALDAQASDGLSCTASPRATVNAFLRQGFQRAAENVWWLVGSAAAGGATGGPVGFLAGLGFSGAGVIADGYLAEFNRYYARCTPQ